MGKERGKKIDGRATWRAWAEKVASLLPALAEDKWCAVRKLNAWHRVQAKLSFSL